MAGVTPCKNDLHPDLCSATSSLWNICARFSDVISRGTSGGVVIGGLFSRTCLSYSVKANIFTIKVLKVVRKEILLKKQMSS